MPRPYSPGAGRFGSVTPGIDRYLSAGRSYVEFGLTNPSHYRLMFMTPKPASDQTDKSGKGQPEEDAYAFLKAIVVELQARGRLRDDLTDVDLAAQTIWATIHGVVSLEIAKCNDAWVEFRSIEARTDQVLTMVERGLLQ